MVGRFLAVRARSLSDGGTVDVDGIAVFPAALLLWEDRATAHFVSVGDQPTDHAEALERWARLDRLGEPPVHPFVDAFFQLSIALVLSDGAEATLVGSSAGGSDSEWEAAARFRFPDSGADGPLVVRMGRRGELPVDVTFPVS
jgi:hypothetical protein